MKNVMQSSNFCFSEHSKHLWNGSILKISHANDFRSWWHYQCTEYMGWQHTMCRLNVLCMLDGRWGLMSANAVSHSYPMIIFPLEDLPSNF
jgi:hypothetical protein